MSHANYISIIVIKMNHTRMPQKYNSPGCGARPPRWESWFCCLPSANPSATENLWLRFFPYEVETMRPQPHKFVVKMQEVDTGGELRILPINTKWSIK